MNHSQFTPSSFVIFRAGQPLGAKTFSTIKKSALAQGDEKALERTVMKDAIKPGEVLHWIAVEGLRAASIVDYGQRSGAAR
jgi:hypothetical protein